MLSGSAMTAATTDVDRYGWAAADKTPDQDSGSGTKHWGHARPTATSGKGWGQDCFAELVSLSAASGRGHCSGSERVKRV